MARFNEILVGRYNRFFQKLLSMKGPASLVTLSDEMFPTFSVFNGVENRFLETWTRYAVYQNVPAVAAQIGACKLRNAPGTNVIAVLEKVNVFSASAANQPILQGTPLPGADYGTAFFTISVDGRDQRPSTLIGSQSGTGVSFATFWSLSGNISTTNNYEFIITDDQELPILPGWAVQVLSNQVNSAFSVAFVWRERLLEDSERQ